MEELKSTELLDKEIENDAVKKAASIKKNALLTVEKTKHEWQKRLETEIAKEKIKFDSAVAAYKKEASAKLLLDKKRFQCKTAGNRLKEAVNTFLDSMERKEIVFLLERIFSLRTQKAFNGDFSVLTDFPPSVFYYSLSAAELNAILGAAFPCVDFSAWQITETPARNSSNPDAALILDTHSTRITASCSAEANEILLDKRHELMQTLLGENYA
ncbi:MAG: hypothetical protein LBD07_06825 [Spirochaetaceae bacterium]|jgi:V/A-type H+-transporting ATPase subunit E|nr:hypothetical protein [Spirochaetaceae bacterium]